jgi:hypothetical protein
MERLILYYEVLSSENLAERFNAAKIENFERMYFCHDNSQVSNNL